MKYLLLLLLAVSAYGQTNKGPEISYTSPLIAGDIAWAGIPRPSDCSSYYASYDPKTGRCVIEITLNMNDREVTCINIEPGKVRCSWFALAPTEPELMEMVEAKP